jgi:hypothetical protein
MALMVAVRCAAGFEFFAQGHQKSLALATQATDQASQPSAHKKSPPRRRAVKSKENLKYLKN